MKSLKESLVPKNYPEYRTIINKLMVNFDVFTSDMDTELVKVLPELRSGVASKKELVAIVEKYKRSVYNARHLKIFLELRKRETGAIEAVLNKAEKEEIVVDYIHSSEGINCIQVCMQFL